MKKNGFTLVEVIAVIVILCFVGLLAVPAVINSISKAREKAYNIQVEEIIKAARAWTEDNINELSDNVSTYVTLEEILIAGYIEEKSLINPIDETTMNGCVTISYADNKYSYSYSDNYCVSSLAFCVGDSVTLVDGSHWHVLSSSGEDRRMIDLISDYTYNMNGTQNTSNNVTTILDGSGVDNYYDSELYQTVKGDFTTALKAKLRDASGNAEKVIVSLPSIAILKSLGCTDSGCTGNNAWVNTGFNYWVRDYNPTDGEVYIFGNSGKSSVLPTTSNHFRPMVTLYKSSIDIENSTSCS